MREKKSPSPSANDAAGGGARIYRGWCLAAGLPGLIFWLSGGLALEALHAFKSVMYLEDPIRRELWTLAHAHGTLFSALALLIALLLSSLAVPPGASRRIDRLFALGACLLPAGFFIGGIVHPEGDPNPAILLVPIGGLCALAGLINLAIAARRIG